MSHELALLSRACPHDKACIGKINTYGHSQVLLAAEVVEMATFRENLQGILLGVERPQEIQMGNRTGQWRFHRNRTRPGER